MTINLVIGIIILFWITNEVPSECICTKNEEETSCVYLYLSSSEMHFVEPEKHSILNIEPAYILPKNAVSFDKVQRLKLQCNLQTLTANSFENQGSLKELDISENSISTIPNDLFPPLPLLEKLNLSYNTLENPTLDTFYALNNIKVLDISHNNISNLILSALDEMKKLEDLYASNNQIRGIELGTFDELHNLRDLDLSYNQIRKIVFGLFDQSPNLLKVNLAGNNFIGELPLGTYDALKNVVTLNLSDCKIEQLRLGVFDETTKLATLDLSRNKMFQLPLGIFDKTEDLQVLNFHSCELLDLPDHVFDQNKKLRELDLSVNRLRTLPVSLFRLNKEFKYLNLSHNLISKLPMELFKYTNLTEIDISHNQFVAIESQLLSTKTLEKIYAQDNHINYLDIDKALSGNVFALKYLDVRNNRLVFLEEAFFKWVPKLERMEIFGNPWDCNCLNDLVAVMTKKFINFTTIDYYDGKLPICVVSGNENSKICSVDVKNVDYYYDTYMNNLF